MSPVRVEPARTADLTADADRPDAGVVGRLRRGSAMGAVVASLVLGAREALDPEGAHEAVVELDPVPGRVRPGPVTFVHVPGSPRASRILLRPWLRSH